MYITKAQHILFLCEALSGGAKLALAGAGALGAGYLYSKGIHGGGGGAGTEAVKHAATTAAEAPAASHWYTPTLPKAAGVGAALAGGVAYAQQHGGIAQTAHDVVKGAKDLGHAAKEGAKELYKYNTTTNAPSATVQKLQAYRQSMQHIADLRSTGKGVDR